MPTSPAAKVTSTISLLPAANTADIQLDHQPLKIAGQHQVAATAQGCHLETLAGIVEGRKQLLLSGNSAEIFCRGRQSQAVIALQRDILLREKANCAAPIPSPTGAGY